MMTPRHGNTFLTTDPLCGEFTTHWWIVPQNVSGAKCDVSFDVEQTHIMSPSMGKRSSFPHGDRDLTQTQQPMADRKQIGRQQCP